MSLIGAFIYMAFGSSELQSWAKSDNQNKEPDAAANTISKKNNSNNNVIQEQPGSNRGPWKKYGQFAEINLITRSF